MSGYLRLLIPGGWDVDNGVEEFGWLACDKVLSLLLVFFSWVGLVIYLVYNSRSPVLRLFALFRRGWYNWYTHNFSYIL